MRMNYFKDKDKESSLKLLQKYDKMFDGTFGKYTGSDYIVELKEDGMPCHAMPFPIPNTHHPALNKQVDRLIKIGVQKNIKNS